MALVKPAETLCSRSKGYKPCFLERLSQGVAQPEMASSPRKSHTPATRTHGKNGSPELACQTSLKNDGTTFVSSLALQFAGDKGTIR